LAEGHLSATKRKNGEQPALPASSLEFGNYTTQLPAAISATAAITAVAVPASATATAATSAPSAAPATTAKSAAAAPATTTAFSRRPRFVNHDVTAHEILAVQSLDGALGFLVAIDLNKPEPAGLPRETVAHQGDIRRGHSRLSK
jgi:hypothetical protein